MTNILKDEQFLQAASTLTRNAEKQILISSFKMEIVKDQNKSKLAALYKSIAQAASEGITVKVILNQLHAKSSIGKTNKKTADLLRSQGIKVKTLPGARVVHAKIIIADDFSAIIGSHNWTESSLTRNFELSIITREKRIVVETTELFNYLWDQAVRE